jgi:hypothetical protein
MTLKERRGYPFLGTLARLLPSFARKSCTVCVENMLLPQFSFRDFQANDNFRQYEKQIFRLLSLFDVIYPKSAAFDQFVKSIYSFLKNFKKAVKFIILK